MDILYKLIDFLPTLLNILGAIGGVFGIIVTIRKGNLWYKKWKQKRAERSRNYFKGNWDNMAQRMLPPSHYFDLEAHVYGKQVEGRVNVRRSDDENSWETFDLLGKRSGKVLRCKLFKNFGGGRIPIASGIFKRNDVGMLWTLKESFNDQFPIQAVLQKGFPSVI
jgi:hypothetical protein